MFKIWNFAELALSSTQVNILYVQERWSFNKLRLVTNKTGLYCLHISKGFVVAVLYCFMNGEVRAGYPTESNIYVSESVEHVVDHLHVHLQVQHEFQRRWRRWRLTQHLPNRPRQHHSSISHSGSPHTQVSLLPCSPGSPAASGLPVDTLEM